MPNPTNGQLRPTTANGPHRQTLAVIGNGMASARLVDDLLERGADQRWHIHVFGEERHSAYNRILLGRVLNGADPGDISLRPAGWHSDAVHHHLGGKVTHLDPLRRQLTLADGTDHRFDAAVLATGSTPFVPPIDGSDKPGVVVYRTLDDVATMRRASVSARSAVVVGGGLLGLEAAKALLDLGLHVTVVHLAGHLMDTQLDAEAGTMLRRRLEQTGLFIRTGVSVQTIHGDPDVDQVTLTDGEVLPADLVVMACGIRPRVDLAKAAGLPTNRAVLVN
ncbi:MAG: FAD-dependent oxidoreductase, partial [Planctomycetota bacterium]